MSEEKQEVEVTEEKQEVEVTEEEQTAKKQAEIWNRQVCEMASDFFKEIASISADEIYKMSSKEGEEGEKSVLLLDTINRVFDKFIENGEGLPRVYFDSYERTVDSIAHTFKLNIKSKLDLNSENLIKLAVGKSTEDISYSDIANALTLPTDATDDGAPEGEDVLTEGGVQQA